MGLIVDSSVVIASERKGYTVERMIRDIVAVTGPQTMALSSVSLTEVVHGIYRADSLSRQLRRQAFVEEVLLTLAVSSYTKDAALIAGRIDGEHQSRGIVVPFSDLLIGATALSLGYSVLTLNLRHFRLIPGLLVIPFELPI